ncbi:hypothetical protein BXZ70DRAFT_1006435 [Cristinia sonorae]|uniref:Glucose receptor Git3 N-terminal domain-containing protein n=1 Tax=Cristinia sonorae TaxID=1940300 RepID=A0A8K0URN7_9AGAR|nr:hypothetical protein BXZ70DRAFT_1006435 [Cristinia sonorae]
MATTPSSDLDTCNVPKVFPFSIRLGLIFITQAAGLSAIAIVCLLMYIAYSAVTWRKGATRRWSMGTHVHWYFLSLLVSDLIQAIGGLLNIEWIRHAGVVEGSVCTTQGVLKQLGDVGVALASLAIAVHTFSAVVLGWRPKHNYTVAIGVLGTIWLFLFLIVVVSLTVHNGPRYYGDTQYWCWITSSYPAQRIALEYVWMWTTALINIILYIPITLVLKGVISTSGGRLKIILQPKCSGTPLSILALSVLPIAIVRWDSFLGHCIPWPATVASDVIFACSGLLNVLLFTVTRPGLIPHRQSTQDISMRTGTLSTLSPPRSFSIVSTPSPTQPHRYIPGAMGLGEIVDEPQSFRVQIASTLHTRYDLEKDLT